MSTKRKNRPTAVLRLTVSAPLAIRVAQAIIAAVTGNPLFPAPLPTILALTALVNALVSAQTAADSRARGAAEARDAAFKALRTGFEQLRVYVQTLADGLAVADAASLIVSAGMAVRKPGVRVRPDFAVKHGALPGVVAFTARSAGKKAIYDWQSSTDQHTWTTVASTFVAKALATGLTSSTVYYFRFRATTPSGIGAWSAVQSLTVL